MREWPVCTICGKALDIFDRQQGFKMQVPRIGYGSIHDGERFRMTMCNKCFDEFVDNTEFAHNPFWEPIEVTLDDESELTTDGAEYVGKRLKK